MFIFMMVRRSTANRPCRYTVVAQLIAKNSGDTEASDEDEFVSYFINDELYICISAAPAVCNGEFDIVVESS
jgi:hypothetical protein